MSLEQKNDDKWINVDPRTKKLSLRFRVRGFNRQFYISTGLKDTKRNREIVRSRRDAIATDISLSRFDDTLESYQFWASNKIEPGAIAAKKPEKHKYNLLELWQKFTDYQETQIEQTTILNRYVTVLRYTQRLPTQSLAEAVEIRDWLINSTTKQMAWSLINHYSQCCEWAINSALITENPFKKLKTKQPKKKTTGVHYSAFTLEHRDIIIKGFESHPKYSNYSSLIKFLFWSGCRPGEAFALTWGDISENCCKININKSRNSHRILKSTKNGIKRVFPTKSGSKLQTLLQEIRPQNTNPNALIFTNELGGNLSSPTMRKIWKGYTCHGYKYTGVVQDLVNKGELPYYLKPYATRHTFATWAITQGISPDKVAKWIGDRVETVLKYYCHPEVVNAECPDF